MLISLREIGRRCKKYRIEIGCYQSNVASATGYSIENISSFENGRNDNARILLWYLANGLPIERLFEGGNNGTDI